MRLSLLGVLALAAVAQVAPAHAQAARTNVVVSPRLLTPDMPHFLRLGGDQTFCVKKTKDTQRKRVTRTTPDNRVFCTTE